MDPSSPIGRPSGIPRPSRLPIPRAGVRPSPSRENLQQIKLGISNPRLRSSSSREHLSSITSSKRASSTPLRSQSSYRQLHGRDSSTGTVIYNPIEEGHENGNRLSRKPSKAFIARAEPFSVDETESSSQRSGSGQLGAAAVAEGYRNTRPSLSERTMGSLQNIPSSPAVKKRTSSFFNPESPMRPPSSGTQSSRPTSSHDPSMGPPSRTQHSRPTSRAGQTSHAFAVDFRASTNTFQAPKSTISMRTPSKRQSISNLRTPSDSRQSVGPSVTSNSKLPSPGFVESPPQRSPSPVRTTPKPANLKSGSQTLAIRPLKPRPSVGGLFRKSSMQTANQSGELDRIGFGPKKKPSTFSNTSSEATSTTSKTSKATASTTASSEDQGCHPRKSSLALRDQIAKAKAAKRVAVAKEIVRAPGPDLPVIPAGDFDFGLSDDPFNQQIQQDGAQGLLKKRIAAARSDGRLNIAAMGLKEIPEEVLSMYNIESTDGRDGSWAEFVDLTRFVAAGNELQVISDDVFPDIDQREMADDEDAKGNQFGALETLDLHGNLLTAIPPGFRRLEHLTTLNLANNKLGNECFEIIHQVASLRDLKLGHNNLLGDLDNRIVKLTNLEVLDLQHNSLTSLPDGLAELVRLRVLNLTENRFTGLPFDELRHLPLIELFAAKNNLTGTLIGPNVDSLPQLQVLDIAGNSLSVLSVSDDLKLPSLHQLSLSSNRLTSLPDLSSWVSLRTLTAEDNNIDVIPEGFVNLQKLKNVDLSGNNIRMLDDKIGMMDSLDIFRISGNPLREKKFSGMTTENLKKILKGRIEPAEVEKETDSEGAFYSAPVSPNRPSSSDWPVQPGGVLDRSNTKSYSLNPVAAAHIAANNAIKTLELHHNVFKEIPISIAFFASTLTSLSMAHNDLSGDSFMKDDLELPVLRELNLSSNTFNSMQPMIQRLQAPKLERLDVSFNRLTSLPPLKPHFPSLVTLLASNNTIKELSLEAVRGLTTLDCSSNDINSLNAKIGLLGGPGGLQKLDVSGNRFRVPKYTVLQKGTEATLSWLRDRIPAGEGGAVDDIAEFD